MLFLQYKPLYKKRNAVTCIQINVKQYEKYYVPNLLAQLLASVIPGRLSALNAFCEFIHFFSFYASALTCKRASSWFHNGIQRWCDKRLLVLSLSWNFWTYHLSSVAKVCECWMCKRLMDWVLFVCLGTFAFKAAASAVYFGCSKIRDRNSSCMFVRTHTNFAHKKCHKIATLWWDGISKVFGRVKNERKNMENEYTSLI